MALLLPKITDPADSEANTLNFTYPPVEKPMLDPRDGDEREGVRSDSFTLSGLRQSMFYRADEFKRLTMKDVPIADISNWRDFIDYAHEGGSFRFYPDATLTAFDEYILEDSGGSNRSQTDSASNSATNWAPKYVVRTIDGFEIVMRKVPGGLSSP